VKICPKCNFDQISNKTKFCPECGTNLIENSNSCDIDDDLKFEVTEKDSQDSEFVSSDDSLKIEGPNSSIENEMSVDPQLEKELEPDDEDLQLIGGIGSESREDETAKDIETEKIDQNSTDKIKILTPDEISQIEKKLYKNDPGLSNNNNEKESDETLFENAPITPPKKEEPTVKSINTDNEQTLDIPSPTMAEHDLGIAYFYKSYIELVGTHDLRPCEELVVGKKTYELKPKQINPKILFGGAVGLFVVLLIVIGSFIAGDATQGQGLVWGIALDELDQPLISNAKVRFPNLDETIECNTEGFFTFKNIPSGTHKIQLIWGTDVIGENFATVSDNKLTILTLRPGEEFLAKLDREAAANSTDDKLADNKSGDQAEDKSNSNNSTSTQQKTKSTKKAKSSKWAKLALESNIDDAVISLDGSVLGAGNLTFSRLKPGEYQYEVKRDGYYPKTGNVTLKAGKTQKIEVALKQLSEEDLRASYSSKDFYNSGMQAYTAEDYSLAIDEFSYSVDKDPSFVDAYKARADIYILLKDWQKGHDDYLRIAEIYQFNKDYNKSIVAYNKAIEIDENSVSAYLGRAKLYMLKKEGRAAIPDFEEVLSLDKRNSEAYYGLGIARYNLQSYKKAIELFKDALSIDEHNPMIHQYLMLSYFARDDKKNLRKAYSKFEEKVNSDKVDEFRSNSENYAVIQIIDRKK